MGTEPRFGRARKSGIFSSERRRRTLLVLVAAQLAFSLVLSAEFLTYFLVGYDHIPWEIVEFFEVSEAVFAFSSIVVGIWMIVLLTRRNTHVEAQLKAASGAMDELMQQRFREWQLTPSESEIALFSLKGMAISEIAQLRGTSEGTIKAQNNAVYRKAGVSGRAQLLGLFVEDLIGGSILPDTGRAEGAPAPEPDHNNLAPTS